MVEKKASDALGAEAVVRRAFETQYTGIIKTLLFRKCWYSSAGTREFWDIEGYIELKKGKDKKRNFRYQVDPYSGEIIGYEETVVLK